VPIYRRTPGSLCRLLLPLAAVAVANIALSVSAQTVPQLLPYTAKLIAGGGPTATFTVNPSAYCPQAGAPYTPADKYGDGCLANEIQLTGPRYAIADSLGNVFISDYTNGLVRRVDAITGIITAVAGSATVTATPGKNAPCTTGSTTLSTDILGDGCLGTQVKLGKPAGLAFDTAGDLIFADSYNYNIRKIAATGGFVPATGGTISLVAGTVGGTTSTGGFSSGVVAATSSYVEDVYGIAADTSGNLFYADEYTKAEDVSVINISASTPDVVTGLTIPAGYTVKLAGATSGGGACINAPTAGFGCTFGTYANNVNALATSVQLDAPYAVGVDNKGNVFIANEFQNSVAKISAAGYLTNYAGINTGTGSTTLTNTTRAVATTIAMGTDFGVAVDNNSNIYVTDALLGYVWRVDGATGYGYVVAGGGAGTCASPNALDTPASYDTDTYGDGCPALQAKLGVGVNKGGYTTTGVFGVTVDANANLYLGDTVSNLVREITSGTQFGVIGANQPTNNLDIHFGAGDAPAATGAYMLTSGASNFSLGTATCTYNNADATTDCVLPVTATPAVLGAFNGKLQVSSNLGGVNSFVLSGTYAQSPITRTTLSYVAGVTCAGTTTYATVTPIALTATVTANGPAPPVGNSDNVTFYANNGVTNSPIGTVAVSNIGTLSAPVYGATLNYTFTTPGTYTLTAVYSGDSYFKTSTGTSTSTITSSTPSFTITPTPYSQSTVTAGQTALYSFTVNQNVYSGTITFTVTGLPANSSYSMSPAAGFTATGCSVTNTATRSIFTQQATKVTPAGFGASGRGPWQMLCVLTGLGLALLIGLRRRRVPLRYGQIWMALVLLISATGMVACGKSVGTVLQPATPAGTYAITVTAVPSVGTAPPAITFPLIVN